MAPSRILLSLAAVSSLCLGMIGACSTDPTFTEETGQGGAGQGGSVGQGGQGDECEVAADCPGDDTECAQRSCDNGFCAIEQRPSGYTVGLQVAGDCRKNACDGEGKVVEMNDDEDAPNDGNDCTADACSGGEPAFIKQREGSPCGIGLSCDADGLCSGCTRAAQCGPDTPCLKQACVEEKCYQLPEPDGGGNVPNQTDEDCQRVVCNGMGGTKTIEDPLDVKPDGNACTIDGCNAGAPSYISVVPQDDANACTSDVCDPTTGLTDHTPTAQGQSCGACKQCNNGSCVSTCSGCDTCQNGACASSCSACETCNGSQCVSNCGGCQQCVNGSCQGGCGPCQQCSNGQCVGGCGACQQCTNGSCTGGCGPCETCQGGTCVSNCGPCQACVNGSCQNTCSACQTCSGGSCVDNCGPCHTCSGGSCQNNCGPCEACVGGSCQGTCGACEECYNNTCYFDACICDPICCNDPCCNAKLKGSDGSQSVYSIPIPCL